MYHRKQHQVNIDLFDTPVLAPSFSPNKQVDLKLLFFNQCCLWCPSWRWSITLKWETQGITANWFCLTFFLVFSCCRQLYYACIDRSCFIHISFNCQITESIFSPAVSASWVSRGMWWNTRDGRFAGYKRHATMCLESHFTWRDCAK